MSVEKKESEDKPKGEAKSKQGLSALDVAINVSKAIGLGAVITGVSAGAIYRNFAREHLGKFKAPLDETQEVLATFDVHKDVDEGGFFFGLATAPAHVEDELDDAWLQFAMETKPKKMKPEHKYPPFGSAGEEEASATSAVKDAPDVTVRGVGEAAIDSSAESKTKQSTTEASMPGAHEPEANGKNGAAAEGDWEVVGSGLKKTVPLSTEVQAEQGTSQPQKALSRRPTRQYSRRTTRDPRLTMTEDVDPFRPIKKCLDGIKRAFFGSDEDRERKRREEEQQKKSQEDQDDDYDPNVAAFHNVPYPEQRLKFWTEPEVEIKLAQEANQSVFRLGVDWGRLVPVEPVDGTTKVVNWEAVKHYRYILEMVRSHNMEIMLSLFHHSLPKWAGDYGGWKDERTIKYFLEFTELVAEEFGDLVKWYITFNEPHVFAMLTYAAGAWPGANPNIIETATSALPKGAFERVMAAMAEAHNRAADILHDVAKKKGRTTKVGISHHVSWMRPYGLFDAPVASISTWMTRYAYVDDVCHKCDFIGINYYGQEFVCGAGLKLVPNEEYSDSGRGVHPDGLYRALILFHERYNLQKKLNVPFYITENGVSDGTDFIRRPYLIEHLLAVRAAMNEGVPVRGYLFWTTSDNWEWADGYGPKFGLVHVDRANNLKRTKRPSFYLYSEISKTGKVTKFQRDEAWNSLQSAAHAGNTRPFFRQVEPNGLMYAGGLDVPIDRPLISRDWRFGHYQPDGLQDPFSRFGRLVLRIFTFNKLGHTRLEEAEWKAGVAPGRPPPPPPEPKTLPAGAPSPADAEQKLQQTTSS